MKLKKLVAGVVTACTALTLTAGLVACGGGDDPEKKDPKPTPPAEATISYQFTGANDELYGYGWAYYTMLNLWSDGTVSGSGYNYLKQQGGLREKWFRGTWSEKNDEDAGKIVSLKAIWDEDATNEQNGESTAGRIENYTLYFDDDGTTLTPFTLKIPLMSFRDAEMTCHVPALYKTMDEFVAGAKKYGEEHKPGAGEEDNYGNALATLTAEDGKTAVFYDSNVVVIDAGYTKPVLGWEYKDGAYVFTETDGNNKGQVTQAAALTVEGTTGTLTYDFMGYATYTYTGDVSKLLGEEEEEPTALATLSTEDGKTVVFYDDGKVKVDTGIPQLSPVWNWKYENGEITLTEEGKDTAPGGVTVSLEGKTLTLVYAPSFLQGQSFTYTGDVSAIVPAQAIATLSTEDGKDAVFYDDGTVKVNAGFLNPVWNWKYEDGTITFTEEGKDTVPGGVTFTLEGTTGTLVYAPSFLQGQSFTYTGDVSKLIA
ncbi:MAG: hypothetical protein J1G38_00965 [Clostridiales bacterium]|nr:hypothetical protein [Clostridiales bacterium]